jgi:hypothetical protein
MADAMNNQLATLYMQGPCSSGTTPSPRQHRWTIIIIKANINIHGH